MLEKRRETVKFVHFLQFSQFESLCKPLFGKSLVIFIVIFTNEFA